MDLLIRFCTPVNACFPGVRTVNFYAFSDEIGFAEVDVARRRCTPANDSSPELDEDYLKSPARDVFWDGRKTGSISKETLPVSA